VQSYHNSTTKKCFASKKIKLEKFFERSRLTLEIGPRQDFEKITEKPARYLLRFSYDNPSGLKLT